MPVMRMRRYDRDTAEWNPETLFLFGDNLQRQGRAGQACIRDLPNALGVPTKQAPSMAAKAFFTDADYDRVAPLIRQAFTQADAKLHANGIVVIPADGLGTGLAELPVRAPRLFRLIEALIDGLETRYGILPES